MKKRILGKLMLVLMAVAVLAGCGDLHGSKLTAKVIEVDLTNEEYAFAVNQNDTELLSRTNEYIAQIMKDGTFDKICDRYFGGGTPQAVHSAPEDSSRDQLRVATNAAFEPFEYMEGDTYLGIDMEIAAGLAEYLGKELVICNTEFDAILVSVQMGSCDIAMSGLTVTDERKELVNFTDSYYKASQKLIVRSDNTEFDNVTDAASIEAILNKKTGSTKVGVQIGTTGKLYCEGDEDWGFAGYAMECRGYKNGSLAVQDMLNGNVDYVVIDAAPAEFITESVNRMQ